jgi:pimeloyl-ACP methyl ester carboxylesterase
VNHRGSVHFLNVAYHPRSADGQGTGPGEGESDVTETHGVGSAWPDRGGHLWPKDREVTRADGTVVRYAVRGPADAPVVVCCAGYLCPDNFWRDIGPDLLADHRVIIPNYRGVGASSEAGGGSRPPEASAYAMHHLADDVAAVLDAEGVRGACAIGHSMGVQVALALWRRRPDLVGSLALVAGCFGTPLRTFYGTRAGEFVFPVVSSVVPALPRQVMRPVMRALELPIAMPIAHAIHALGPNTPDDGMATYRLHLGRVDPRTAIWTARGMQAFDAGAWLHEIDVPVSVTVGDVDAWCPVDVGRRLADRVPGAELTVVAGGSHALPIEFPDVVTARVRSASLTDPRRGRSASLTDARQGRSASLTDTRQGRSASLTDTRRGRAI